MENNTRIAYDALCAEEQNLLATLARKHQMIEMLAEELGEAPPSLDIPLPMSDGIPNTITAGQAPPSFVRARGIQVRPTEFYQSSLAGAVLSYLEKTPDKAATFPEILSALQQGAFQMETGKAAEAQIRLNLLKSTNFTLMPNNMFGLSSVYNKTRKKSSGRKPKPKKKKVVKVTEPKKQKEKPPKVEQQPVEKVEQ
jgi:hypothetical protein